MSVGRPTMSCIRPSDGGWQGTSDGSSTLGDLLRHYRTRAGLTQQQLTNRLNRQGFWIGDKTLSMWETGQRLPSNSASFHYLGVCLGLKAEEEAALVDAHRVTFDQRFMADYWRIKELET